MPLLAVTAVGTIPLVAPVKLRGHIGELRCLPTRVSMQSLFSDAMRGYGLSGSSPLRLTAQLQSIDARRPLIRSIPKKSSSVTCSAMTTRCAAASGQIQTLNRETKTAGKVHHKDQIQPPRLDNNGPGFPPFRGGGGGGGGGGFTSGGFFLFAFLGFLDFLKDLEPKKKRD